MPFPGTEVVNLDHKLKATDIACRFGPPLDSPSHMHERGNRNRSFEHRKTTAHKGVRLEWTRTKNANAAVAEIMNAAVKFLFLGQGIGRLTRWQAPRVYFEHLRKTLMLASFSI